jgi:hypothetical protein
MENSQVELSSNNQCNISIDTDTNQITIENHYANQNVISNTIESCIEKIIYPSDISDLFLNIKQYLDDMGINILNKTPRFQQMIDFSQLLYKYIPEYKTDIIDHYNNTNKNYIDENDWHHV